MKRAKAKRSVGCWLKKTKCIFNLNPCIRFVWCWYFSEICFSLGFCFLFAYTSGRRNKVWKLHCLDKPYMMIEFSDWRLIFYFCKLMFAKWKPIMADAFNLWCSAFEVWWKKRLSTFWHRDLMDDWINSLFLAKVPDVISERENA